MNNFSRITYTQVPALTLGTPQSYLKNHCSQEQCAWRIDHWPNEKSSKLSVVITFHNEPEIWRKRKENPEPKGCRQEDASSPVLPSLPLSHLRWPQTPGRDTDLWGVIRGAKMHTHLELAGGPACGSPRSPHTAQHTHLLSTVPSTAQAVFKHPLPLSQAIPLKKRWVKEQTYTP